jgi:hypothetical protein
MLHLPENDGIDIVRLPGDAASISGGQAEKKFISISQSVPKLNC